MSIPTTCPSCRAAFDVPDRLAGKKIRCKSCREEFRVGGAVARDDYDDEPGPRASGASSSLVLVLVIVGVLAIGMLSVGGAAVWYLMSSKGRPAVVARGGAGRVAPPGAVLPDQMLPGPHPPHGFGRPDQPTDGPVLVTLSNPRKVTGLSDDGPTYQIDFKWDGQLGNLDHPHIYVKTAGGVADAVLRHDRRKGSGTLSLAFVPGQDPGPGFEVWIALQKLNKHNWEYTRLSNVVTVN